MVISFDFDFMTEHDRLNRDEAIIFVLFLMSELQRHKDDIDLLAKRIAYMENKHDFKSEDEYFKRIGDTSRANKDIERIRSQ